MCKDLITHHKGLGAFVKAKPWGLFINWLLFKGVGYG
jgi:hypothetical protein